MRDTFLSINIYIKTYFIYACIHTPPILKYLSICVSVTNTVIESQVNGVTYHESALTHDVELNRKRKLFEIMGPGNFSSVPSALK